MITITNTTKDFTPFPSPLGVSYFQIERKKIMVKLTILKFPSPLGVSYFQILWSRFLRQCILFPSPLGVSYFQIVTDCVLYTAFSAFPSPLGVSYFQIKTHQMNKSNKSAVSVPSRGILFPNNGRHGNVKRK